MNLRRELQGQTPLILESDLLEPAIDDANTGLLRVYDSQREATFRTSFTISKDAGKEQLKKIQGEARKNR